MKTKFKRLREINVRLREIQKELQRYKEQQDKVQAELKPLQILEYVHTISNYFTRVGTFLL